jgi:hypothetical protein
MAGLMGAVGRWDTAEVRAAQELAGPLSVCTDPMRPHTLYVVYDNGRTISALDRQTGTGTTRTARTRARAAPGPDVLRTRAAVRVPEAPACLLAGAMTPLLKLEGAGECWHLCLDVESDCLLASDVRNNDIHVMALTMTGASGPDGAAVRMVTRLNYLASPGGADAGLRMPNGIGISPGGVLYVADSDCRRIVSFNIPSL